MPGEKPQHLRAASTVDISAFGRRIADVDDATHPNKLADYRQATLTAETRKVTVDCAVRVKQCGFSYFPEGSGRVTPTGIHVPQPA